MAWYWIVLIYFLMWIITAVVMFETDMIDEEGATLFGCLWPVMFPVAIVRVILMKLFDLLRKIKS